ncbi:MAG: UDP-N-acetylmuramoyl-L-alanine--D-glutamate ligase [Patescibacteria group bacterium]|jgi:UDP-N-acetylmuramoylalanine--D-glutamate ligase
MAVSKDFELQYKNKKILIFGLGIQGGGVETAFFFATLGCEVRVTDQKTPETLAASIEKLNTFANVSYTLGEHTEKDIRWADVIIQNPGVKFDHPLLILARKLQKQVTMEIAIFMKYTPSFTIGITGTRGKSTTTAMIYDVLRKHSGKRVELAGNVPDHAAIRLLGQQTENDITVLELSSYQLHSFEELKARPNIAVFTNFYPDHLNYHGSMDAYLQDKINIFRFQEPTDSLVTTSHIMGLLPAESAVKSTVIIASKKDFNLTLKHLFGEHNYNNAALALAVARLCKIPEQEALSTIADFKGLHFRLEKLGTIHQVPFYNDSTSTTPIACITALKAISKQENGRSIILILGGNSKNLPTEELLENIGTYASRIVLLAGTMTDEVKSSLSKPLVSDETYSAFERLFESLIPKLTPQDVVLFSPAATSFATFKNEFDRGNQFTNTFVSFQKKYGT